MKDKTVDALGDTWYEVSELLAAEHKHESKNSQYYFEMWTC